MDNVQVFVMALRNAGDMEIRPIIDKMKSNVMGLIKYGSNDWKSYRNGELKPLKRGVQEAIRSGNVINWGNHIFRNHAGFKVNLPESIPNASNKAKARRLLRNYNPDMIPETWFAGEDGFKFPLIARPPKHYYGNDFYRINTYEELVALNKEKGGIEDWYFSAVFPKTTEYRVHVGHGRVIAVWEKALKDGRANNAGDWPYIGWNEIRPELAKIAIESVSVLGLDYAGVDVMYDANEDKYVICEVNTNPGVDESPYMIKKYAAYFDWLVRHNYPKPIEYNSRDYIFTTHMLAQ